MSWSKYAEFLAFAVVLVIIPGPDFAVVTKNTLVGGRRRGRWTALGVSVGYLAYLGAQAIRSAVRGQYQPADEADDRTKGMAGWRQGFISNITNPKVLVFYLAALPQFLTPGAGLGWLLVLAWSHAVISLSYLFVLVTGLHGARRLLMRRRVRRGLDATTGAVLLGFSAKLATAHV
jgi:threonine/homoserine/homoserine lactone efflux protein